MIKSRIPLFIFHMSLLSAICMINAQDYQVSFVVHSEEYIIDSLIYKQSGITYKEVITYNESNNNFTILKQKFQNSWINNYSSTYTYDDNGNLLTELYEDWDIFAAAWINNMRKTSTYDERNNQLTYAYENWDSDNGQWVASRRYTNTYDEHNNQLSQLIEDWSSASSSWSTYQQVTSTYDDDGNRLSTEWDYISNIWKDDWLNSYTYDSTGNPTSNTQAIREPNTTEWINNTRYFNTYDPNGNVLITQTERWNTYIDEWYQGERTVFTYDSSGNLIKRVHETPILNTDLWKATSYRFFYSYNENNELIYEMTEKWDLIDSTWFEYKKVYYDYDGDGNLVNFAAEFWDNGNWRPKNSTLSFDINEKSISYQVEELTGYYSVIQAGSEENELLSFTFEDLDPPLGATISGTDIKAVVPSNTDITGLVPSIEISDLATVSPASGVAQDFSSPVVYTVTAENGDEKSYTVEVKVSTGVPGKEVIADFNMYPNPASTYLYFNIAQTIEIFNAKGLLIKALENANVIHISDLNPGVYFIRNSSGRMKKLLVQ